MLDGFDQFALAVEVTFGGFSMPSGSFYGLSFPLMVHLILTLLF